MLKRGFDFCVAFTVLVMAIPVMALIAILLAASIGRPVLFRQQRPGLRAQPFMLYKFRTMSERRDAQGELLGDELRLTTVGSILRRLSLDELPQLFNVLKGDMSLVGPRPLLMEYLPLYSTEQARRHDVRPGITGWAQVNGRNAVAWEARFALDVWYVEHQSFKLDLRILWLTVLRVLRSDGINQPGAATMQKFTGGQHERR
ncbi:MAG: sugar transferase [Betaproteobacteria bacterium]|jgi:sugar transferase EpsL